MQLKMFDKQARRLPKKHANWGVVNAAAAAVTLKRDMQSTRQHKI